MMELPNLKSFTKDTLKDCFQSIGKYKSVFNDTFFALQWNVRKYNIPIDKSILQIYEENPSLHEEKNSYVANAIARDSYLIICILYSIGAQFDIIYPFANSVIKACALYQPALGKYLLYDISHYALCLAILTGIRGHDYEAMMDRIIGVGSPSEPLRSFVQYLKPDREYPLGIATHVDKIFGELVAALKSGPEKGLAQLKKYVSRQWIHRQTGGYIDAQDRFYNIVPYYGLWCIEAAAFVRMYGLDDSSLKNVKYYPYDFAHFLGDPYRPHDAEDNRDIAPQSNPGILTANAVSGNSDDMARYVKYRNRKIAEGKVPMDAEAWIRRYGTKL